jgi:hypothetical protein
VNFKTSKQPGVYKIEDDDYLPGRALTQIYNNIFDTLK